VERVPSTESSAWRFFASRGKCIARKLLETGIAVSIVEIDEEAGREAEGGASPGRLIGS
jgi:hypothetical protein